ncbi:MAG TPA: Gfo/Idh/MocA family oxidoreductase [Candidatus Solibacter sp.]|nr:Gfo/Idh/MocA family oxidoreductase [Candidatus Solibacter sp.]
MSTTRRHFLGATFLGATGGVGLAGALAADEPQSASPNDRIRIALIGAGGQGSGDVRQALNVGGVELAAVSDIYDGRLTRAREIWGDHVFTTRDYREVLARPDIDAVIVATPDHWHRTISIDAMNAGKDVYCEKPMVQQISDGQDVIATQKRTGRIMQVGSQRVSSVIYRKAKELLAAGAIGELSMVEAWVDRNSALGAWQYSIPPDASPATVDWDRFLGRAPKVGFEPIRLFRWRNYRDYGTGVPGDLFVHLISGLHFVLDSNGPTRVYATGGLRFWKDGRDVPDVMVAMYDYPAKGKFPAFNMMLRVNLVDGASETMGYRFMGSEGILSIGDGVSVAKQPRESEPGYTIDTFPKAVQEQFLKDYRQKYPKQPPIATGQMLAEEKFMPPKGYSDHFEHMRVFIDAVRARKPVVEDPTFGFRAAGPALLSNVSYFEQRICAWDPETMTLTA